MDELLQLLMQQGAQVDPYGAQPNVVGPRGYERGTAAPLPFPKDQPGPGLLPKTFMHNGMPVTLPPAQTEDSPNAYWDAQRMGNGKGRSFYDVDGEAYYNDYSGMSGFGPEVTDLGMMMVHPPGNTARDAQQFEQLNREGYMLSEPPPDDVSEAMKDRHSENLGAIDSLINLLLYRHRGDPRGQGI